MRRLLLALATLVVVLAAIGAVTRAVQANAEPTIKSSNVSVAAECVEMTPAKAPSADARCRDYLYQVNCQFTAGSRGSVSESWEGWCKQNVGLEQGGQPEVPRCDTALAGQKSVVGERCRDFLAATECFNGTSSQADMKEFCAKVAPGAGPDPRPIECTTTVAHEPSPEGNRCWTQLEKKYCAGGYGNTGAQDLNEFCKEVAAGKKPPTVDSKCDLAMAGQNTDAGHACRDQLYTTECQSLSKRPPDVEEFCQAVTKERQTAKEAEEKKKSEATPPPAAEPGKKESPPPSQGAPNVMLQLGHEPVCNHESELNPEIQRACKLTGSAMHDFPFANYGIDNNVSVDVLHEDFWSGETPIMSLFQWLLVGVWQILIWLVKISLLVLQWAFAVDPLSRAQDKVSGSVMALFNLIGPEWRLTALAILGVWGFWSGLVRRRFTQTLSGLLLSLLLMIGAMWIVYDPEGTVGRVAHYANDSAAVMLSATSSGELRRPEQGLAEGQRKLFDQLVVGPWCALQFGGQEKCNEPTSDPKITRSDLWLGLAANSSAREVLYVATKEGPEAAESKVEKNSLGDFLAALGNTLCTFTGGLADTCVEDKDGKLVNQTAKEREDNPEKAKNFEETKAKASQLIKKDPSAVVLQGSEGVFTRAGLLAIIAIGILGAVAFFLSIGVRLVVAGVILLFLIMLAPLMMVVAAFGEEGRGRVYSYGKMMLGAAAAKFVYSTLLGLGLLIGFILMGIGGQEQDWLGGWLLVSAFFWVAVLQMNRILALLSPDPASEQSNGVGASAAMFMGQRMVSGAIRNTWQGATFLPRRAIPRAGRAIRREHAIAREGTDAAIRGQAGDELKKRAAEASRRKETELGARAQDVLEQKRSEVARRRVKSLDKSLERKNLPAPRRERLERQRREAQRAQHRHEAEEAQARWQLQRGSQGEKRIGEAEQRALRFERQQDVGSWAENSDSWSSESNRRWAGIGDAEWKRAERASTLGNSKPMAELRERSEAALRRDRDLLARSDKQAPMTRKTRKEALNEWGGRGSDRSGPARHPDRGFALRERKERRASRRRGRENLRGRRL